MPGANRTCDVEIRPATRADLDALVGAFGQRVVFADRIGRTRQNAGVLLVAWSDGRPVGNVYLWCEALEEPELRAAFPGVPLLNHLEVSTRDQGLGIGTLLVRACEATARGRGYTRMLLGVGVDNQHARRLYERLGWHLWDAGPIVSRWTEPDGAGGIRAAELAVDVMIREL